MPGFDGTGPGGQGPRTGGGFGWCPPGAGPAAGAGPGGVVYGVGRGGRPWGGGRGRCFGGGRGWATGGLAPYSPPAYAAPTPENEVAMLQEQAGFLKTQLDGIHARLEELKKQTE